MCAFHSSPYDDTRDNRFDSVVSTAIKNNAPSNKYHQIRWRRS